MIVSFCIYKNQPPFAIDISVSLWYLLYFCIGPQSQLNLNIRRSDGY
jgi:hypothetical protein